MIDLTELLQSQTFRNEKYFILLSKNENVSETDFMIRYL